MSNGKQLIVLAGSGRKGIVKLTTFASVAKGSCSLDFRPANAKLFLIGSNIAQIELKDINSTFEVPFSSNGDVSCLVRSSSVTMFGGDMPHSEIIKRVDEFLKSSKPSQSAPTAVSTNNSDKGETLSGGEKRPDEHASAQNDSEQSDDLDEANISPPSRNGRSEDGADVCSDGRGALQEALKDWTRFDGNNFYYAVRPQLDEMFVRYPADELLSNTVQNSKWVRVDAADGAYSVGILYDGDEPTFICYAVPEAQSDRRPPAEIESMCVWLPVSSPSAPGYWVIYQSAKTGEIIK